MSTCYLQQRQPSSPSPLFQNGLTKVMVIPGHVTLNQVVTRAMVAKRGAEQLSPGEKNAEKKTNYNKKKK